MIRQALALDILICPLAGKLFTFHATNFSLCMSLRILWADDEIDLLKPQLLFLEKKGHEVTTVTNAHDALEEAQEHSYFDVVFLDENMPGKSGLDILPEIKAARPNVPVVMITKSEEENIMEEAIGGQIADYLIKPVKPTQILLTLKKLTEGKELVRSATASQYQQQFRELLMEINSGPDHSEWVDIYKKIIAWELRLDSSRAEGMADILAMQKQEANGEFSKYVVKNYLDWMNAPADERPTFSHELMRQKVLPYLSDERPTVMVLFDNLRYDQWRMLQPIISELYTIEEEDYFYSILPTSTQYSRNAIFSGMMPAQIAKTFPDKWLNDNEKGGKNMHEGFFLSQQLKRVVRKEVKHSYTKITQIAKARDFEEKALDLLNNDLSVVVYNFIDMLSHARTEMEVLKELAGDESAYRSLTRSWFMHSPIYSAMKKWAERDVQVIVTTDHGTIRVNSPSKVVGDRETTTNLRYKLGRNLTYDKKDVLEIRKPEDAGLPRPNVSSSYIFAKEDKFFLYPNNYNHYHNYYKNTFQHGGISLEEVVCPVVRLRSRG